MLVDGEGHIDVAVVTRDGQTGKTYKGTIRLFKPFTIGSIKEAEDLNGIRRHIVTIKDVSTFALDAQNLDHAVNLLTNPGEPTNE